VTAVAGAAGFVAALDGGAAGFGGGTAALGGGTAGGGPSFRLAATIGLGNSSRASQMAKCGRRRGAGGGAGLYTPPPLVPAEGPSRD
jgi:hypothetical protein